MSHQISTPSDRTSVGRRTYSPPKLEEFGTVTDLTRVGITLPGGDVLAVGKSEGRDGGSVYPGGLG